MNKFLLTLLVTLFAASTVFAQSPAPAAAKSAPAAATPASGSCEAKAVDKNGKALAGAAKASSIKKCLADAKGGK